MSRLAWFGIVGLHCRAIELYTFSHNRNGGGKGELEEGDDVESERGGFHTMSDPNKCTFKSETWNGFFGVFFFDLLYKVKK